MQKNKSRKKLALNKETVRALDTEQLSDVNGGGWTTWTIIVSAQWCTTRCATALDGCPGWTGDPRCAGQ